MAAVLGVAVIGLAAASDFIVGSFWSGHAMLTSLLASLIVLGVTVAVLNEWLERRDRRAGGCSRSTCSGARPGRPRDLDEPRRTEAARVAHDDLLAAARRALDTAAISDAAIAGLLADPERRQLMAEVVAQVAARHPAA